MDAQVTNTNSSYIPAHSLLDTLGGIGALLIAGSLVFAGWIFYVSEIDSEDYCDYYRCDTGFDWFHWVIPLFFGIVLCYQASKWTRYFYKVVREGKVVDKNFVVSGYEWVYSSHQLLLLGHNRAGEQVKYWRSVTQGTYEQYQIGDHYPKR